MTLGTCWVADGSGATVEALLEAGGYRLPFLLRCDPRTLRAAPIRTALALTGEPMEEYDGERIAAALERVL